MTAVLTFWPEQEAPENDINDRRTPADLFDSLHRRHHFTIDVAASADNAKLPRYYTKQDDALQQSWSGERVWCNPPFTDLQPWVSKAQMEVSVNGCELVVMLLPANRTDQPFWSDYIEPVRDGRSATGPRVTTEFVAGRPRFGFPLHAVEPKGGWRPPFGIVLVTWEHR